MPQITYYTAPWCSPCRSFGPVWNRVASGSQFRKINIEEEREHLLLYHINVLPTILITAEGKEVARHEGTMTEQQLRDFVQLYS